MLCQYRCEPRFRTPLSASNHLDLSCMIFISGAIFILFSSFKLRFLVIFEYLFFSLAAPPAPYTDGWNFEHLIFHAHRNSALLHVRRTIYLSKQAKFVYVLHAEQLNPLHSSHAARRIEQNKHDGIHMRYILPLNTTYFHNWKKYNFGIFAVAFFMVVFVVTPFQWINWRSWACVPSSVVQCWKVFANGIFWYTILFPISGSDSGTGIDCKKKKRETRIVELSRISHLKLQSWLGRTLACCWLKECHSIGPKLATVQSPERTANEHSFLRRISLEWPGLLSESICHVGCVQL